MIFPMRRFLDYASRITILSKEEGAVPLVLWGTQREALRIIANGLEDGRHSFVFLKGRQIGLTTVLMVLVAFWLQRYGALQGSLVPEEAENLAYLRNRLRHVLASAPRPEWSLPEEVDNPLMMEWSNLSSLLFTHAGKGGNLGRSRGVNVLLGTEVGSWHDEEGAASLRASLAESHPRRLYLWDSTGRGFNLWRDMWIAARSSESHVAAFLGWWLHEARVLRPEDGGLWEKYTADAPTDSEKLWMRAVHADFGREISLAQLAWYRSQLWETFDGDETLLAQEHPCLPEDAFQSFGVKFIPPKILQKLRRDVKASPTPKGYRYEWGQFVNTTEVKAADPEHAELVVWEEPEAEGVYMVAGHPAFSSSPASTEYVAQVFRLYPDAMIQVAEFATESCAMFHLGWACIHLLGAYRTNIPPYFALEIAGSGMEVLQGIQRLERFNFGISTDLRVRGHEIMAFLGSARHYLYRRPDTFSAQAVLQWMTTPQRRPAMLHSFRDTLERGAMTLRSSSILDQSAALRQGESGDNDAIGASGRTPDSRVMCAALANKHWLETAIADLAPVIPPKETPPGSARRAEERLVGDFFSRLGASGGQARLARPASHGARRGRR